MTLNEGQLIRIFPRLWCRTVIFYGYYIFPASGLTTLLYHLIWCANLCHTWRYCEVCINELYNFITTNYFLKHWSVVQIGRVKVNIPVRRGHWYYLIWHNEEVCFVRSWQKTTFN